MHADAPGMTPDDIHVELCGDTLVVSGGYIDVYIMYYILYTGILYIL